MSKFQVDLPLLLPDVPNACLQRIITAMKAQPGVTGAYVKDGDPVELCTHCDPAQLSLACVTRG